MKDKPFLFSALAVIIFLAITICSPVSKCQVADCLDSCLQEYNQCSNGGGGSGNCSNKLDSCTDWCLSMQ
jgi:hypothetical protein